MISPKQWVKTFDKESKVPASVIEEATHNCITEEFVRRIQEDARLQGLVDAFEMIKKDLAH